MIYLQEPLSKAQKNKNYLEKLKKNGKYEEYKQTKAVNRKKLRESKKEEESKLSLNVQKELLESRRIATRDRVRKHRKEKKERELEERSKGNIEEPSYRCPNTLAKAAKKVERVLPLGTTKRSAVLTKVINDLDETEKENIIETITKSNKNSRCSIGKEIGADIREFFERDDISRVSPKIKDVKVYKNAETGIDVLLPTRHMVLTIREAYALFVEDREQSGKGK